MSQITALLTNKGLTRELPLRDEDPFTGQKVAQITISLEDIPEGGLLIKSIKPGEIAGEFILKIEYPALQKEIIAKKEKQKPKKKISRKKRKTEIYTREEAPEIDGAEFLGIISLPLRHVPRYIYKKGVDFYALRKGASPEKWKLVTSENDYGVVLESVKARITLPNEYETFKEAMMQELNITRDKARKWLLIALLKGDIVASNKGKGGEEKIIMELKQ